MTEQVDDVSTVASNFPSITMEQSEKKPRVIPVSVSYSLDLSAHVRMPIDMEAI